VSKEGISTLKFSPKLKYLANALPDTAYESLAEVLKPIFTLQDPALLHEAAAPAEVQLRMTVYMLRHTHNLIEEIKADTRIEQLLMTAALRCPSLESRRKG
jgi:hypothetical protein